MFDDMRQLEIEFYELVSDTADELVRRLIDERVGDSRGWRVHSVVAGEALIMLGVAFAGTALSLEANDGLAVGLGCLDKLKELAQAKAAEKRN